ncbi:hypothetical protein LTR56_013045 [Elasticomyces elasticus]|nr:hypothetical protein LTR22_025137 [Elasticomyces elasticus]KAK3638405.1 hypothetical protein LTR56_013045 [Elasticomyces elasticus]KAK4920501.1 hypothetical protein LTR49_011916 [Elasticomyces elasticus]KAK5758998.1 hypothetical protein LTS12_010939 [Elasticomyces elasticus]
MSNVGPPYITHINYFCPAPEQHHGQQHTSNKPVEPLDNPGHDNENIYADEFTLRASDRFDPHYDHHNDDGFIRHWQACNQEQRRRAAGYQAMYNISGFQQAMLAEDALMGLDHYSCPYCASMGVRPPRQGLGMGGMRGPGTWGGMGALGSGYGQNTMGQGMMPPPLQAPYMPNFAPNNLPGPSHPVAAPTMPNIVPNNLPAPGRPVTAPGAHIVANQQPVYQAPVVAQAFAQASAGPSCTGHARHVRHVREQESAGLLSRMYRALW